MSDCSADHHLILHQGENGVVAILVLDYGIQHIEIIFI
jgi:hypothetical protein